jgi:hypothetical protein
MYFECGALASIPDKSEPDTDIESDAMTYTGVHCLDVIFKWGMLTLSTMLDNLISTLEYIYSIFLLGVSALYVCMVEPCSKIFNLPQEQNSRARVPPGYNIFRGIEAMLCVKLI